MFSENEVNWEDHLIIIKSRKKGVQNIGRFYSPECPVLLVATPGPEGVNPLGSQLGHRSGAGQLKIPLLPEKLEVG